MIWKQREGLKATYKCLINIFEDVGCAGYADTVRTIACPCKLTKVIYISLFALMTLVHVHCNCCDGMHISESVFP